jgi:outer membrane protein OmpA-like peptidoglycan-associated protein
MIKKFLLACLFVPGLVNAQSTQWATRVIEFSSELTDIQYSAEQVLGKPNVLPVGGESPNAWTPDKPNKPEFLKVGFDTPMRISQVMIAESYNPTAITNIYGYDTNNQEYLLWTFTASDIPIEGRLINVIFDQTSYKVAAIKLEFDGATVPEYYSIDAIGVTDSPIPYVVEVDLPENLNAELNTERLSEKVNSPYKEYKPLLAPDGKTLFFSRQNHPGNVGGQDDPEDIWYSELDENGEWKEAENASELNTAGPNFISALTPDGSSVVMLLGNKYKDNGKMQAGVSVATKEGDEWGEPQNLDIINDYNYSDKAHYFLSNNRQVLFLAVERENTSGGRDLYVSFLMEDGRWSEPMNIGGNVNTASDESAPFLAADDKTLYFSSNGYAGFGGHDIYVTTRLDDTWLNWSDPQNMGPNINTDQEDLFFYIPVTGNFAYYSRGINESDADIYRIEMPLTIMPDEVIIVKGRLLNSETGKPIEATIIYEKLPDGVQVGITKSNPETGEYEIVLPVGELYGFRAESEGFIAISENIDLRDREADYKDVSRDLGLVPVKVEVTIVMNNVFFDFDKSVIKPASISELNRITEFLKENESVKIEIAGHTDSTGPEEYNKGLSQRRANSVLNYFAKNGVAKERLSLKYFGEANPVASNSTIEGRKQNRRVEFKILED